MADSSPYVCAGNGKDDTDGTGGTGGTGGNSNSGGSDGPQAADAGAPALTLRDATHAEDGSVWNFAFGANLSRRILTGRRTIEPIESWPAVVHGWELSFDYKGLPFLEPGFGTLRACTSHTDVCARRRSSHVCSRLRATAFDRRWQWSHGCSWLPRCTCSLHLVRAND